jgi:signal transduction histidine kinase
LEFPAHDLMGAAFGVGLRGMTERMRQLRGDLQFSSTEGGTTITATLPLRDSEVGA